MFYYNVDLREVGSKEGLPPKLVLPLIEGLPDDSMMHAMRNGGIGFLGWGQERALLSATYDAIRDLTLVSGQWKKNKRPNFKPWPRPWDKDRNKDGTKKKATVKDLFRKIGGAGKRR